jgi:hypothetical protein
MKKKLNKAEKFLAEIGIREFRRGFPSLSSVSIAVDMYVNYTWKRLENNQRTHVLEILEEAFALELPEGYWTCTYRDELLDPLETKLAYTIKDYNQYNQYAQIINHFVFVHLLLRTERNLESSWLPYDRKFFEFKFS